MQDFGIEREGIRRMRTNIILISIIFILLPQSRLYGGKQLVGIEVKPLPAVQIIYEYNPDATLNNNIGFGKTGIGLDGSISKIIGLKITAVLKNNYFEIYDAYGRLCFKKGDFENEIRIGQFTLPFSMERLIPFPRRDFIHNAIATGLVSTKDLGIGLYGDCKYAEYGLALINGTGWNVPEENSYKDIIARLVLKANVMKIGGSLYLGKAGADSLITKKNRYNLQGEIKYKGATLRSEYVVTQDVSIEGYTYYLQGGYQHSIRKPYLEAIEPVVRYEFYAPDKSVIDNDQSKITAGINLYFLSHRFKAQLNYVNEKIDGGNPSNIFYVAIQFVL